MYSPDRRRYSKEVRPDHFLAETWDNPSKVVADLKRLGRVAIRVSRFLSFTS